MNLGVLLFALGVVSALKGLTPYVDQTAAYLYYTDYRFGFVARGLVGQLFSPLLAATPPHAHRWLLVGWHYATLALLLALLARFAARTVAAAGGRADVAAMAALVFCSPLVPSLANFTAAPDVLLCLLTLGVVAAARAGRLGVAWALFVAGVLAHQLMLFLALPLMVLASPLPGGGERHRPWVAAAGSLTVGVAAFLLVALAPAPDERFVGVFVEAGVPPGAARSLFEDQLGQTTRRMLGALAKLWRRHTLNGLIALTYGAGAGVVVLAACLLAPGGIRAAQAPLAFLPRGRARTALAVLLVVGAGLGPLLVLALAYDLSRLAALATFASFLAAGLVLRGDPAAARQGGSGPAAVACGALAAAYLCLPFLGLWFEAGLAKRDELLVPNPVLEFRPTRALVELFLAFYGRDAP